MRCVGLLPRHYARAARQEGSGRPCLARYVHCGVRYAADRRATGPNAHATPHGDPAILPDRADRRVRLRRRRTDRAAAHCSHRLPGEDFVYLGDTARLPYGTKSPGSIRQYSLQAARLLHERGVKCLVVACNTASAVALDALDARIRAGAGLGVLEPGAAAACRATRAGRIAVLATESTVRGGAYQAAISRQAARRRRHGARLPVVRRAGGGGLDGRPDRRAA